MDMNIGSFIVDIIALFISAYAIYLSKKTEKNQQRFSSELAEKEHRFSALQNKPDCRIKVTSIESGRGLAIRLENVGTGIMIVDSISYSLEIINPDTGAFEKKSPEYLSKFFYEIPCETRSEANLKGNHLLPNSNHNLYKSTFYTQEDLLAAWELIKDMEIEVQYHSINSKLVNADTYTSDFKTDYDVFKAALMGSDGNLRNLKGFSRE